jgi:predicted XRE-type DNA-binding protein
VRHDAAYQLHKVQMEGQPDDFKPMSAIDTSVEEIRIAGSERYEMKRAESFRSVWDALADTPGQAANLQARAELMQQIAAFVKRPGWTQVEAAGHYGVTQPRSNDLLRGRVSRFPLDALVNISTALGCRVRVELEAA